MTNLEAVKADIAPYTADKAVIEKALIDNSIYADDDYKDRRAIANVSIQVLTSFLALKSESEGSFSQSYSIEGLQSRINQIAQQAGIELNVETTTTVRDKSNSW